MSEEKVRVKANISRTDWGNTWDGIREIMQRVLKEFRFLGAKQVNLRLNESNETEKRPVFIDWVAVPEIFQRLAQQSDTAQTRQQVSNVGLYRFGEGLHSRVYEDAVDKALALQGTIDRDWHQDLAEKKVESKLLVQKAGLMYQKFIGIIAEQAGSRRCVGLLTVSFERKPRNLRDVDAKMKKWASWPKDRRSKKCRKSRLVKYIEQNIALGGPAI